MIQAFALVEDANPSLQKLTTSFKGRMENLFLPKLREVLATALEMYEKHLTQTLEVLRRRAIWSLDTLTPLKTINELKVYPGFVGNVHFGLLGMDYGPQFQSQWDFHVCQLRVILVSNPLALESMDSEAYYRSNEARMGLASKYGLYHLTFGISSIIVERDIGAIRSHDTSSRQSASDETFETESILRRNPAVLARMQQVCAEEVLRIEEEIATRIKSIPTPSFTRVTKK
jgi:hypothetical protein